MRRAGARGGVPVREVWTGAWGLWVYLWSQHLPPKWSRAECLLHNLLSPKSLLFATIHFFLF